MTDSFIGKTIGRYRIESEIGRGGMGVVFRGRQVSLNRPVAIKVLPPQLALDEEFVQRFRQEAQTIAGLAHEHIIHVYDIEEAEGAYFIIMELVDGQSLRALMDRRRLTLDEVRVIGVALAQALAYAHDRGIVHRDIKSPNVMISTEGKVKLMDFGIARVAGGAVRTRTGSVLGTPEYMAPEQARSGEISPRTDIYSLGVLLYEMAAGRLPFTGSDPFSVALKHVSEAPPPPRELDPELPEWLEAVILKAISKDPADRYASAAELARDLKTASSPGAAAGPVGAGPAAAGVAAAVVVSAGSLTPLAAGAPAPATGAETPVPPASLAAAATGEGAPVPAPAAPPASAALPATGATPAREGLSRFGSQARQAVERLPPWGRWAVLAAGLVLVLAAVLMALPGQKPVAEPPAAATAGDQGGMLLVDAEPLSGSVEARQESRPARPLTPLDEVLEEREESAPPASRPEPSRPSQPSPSSPPPSRPQPGGGEPPGAGTAPAVPPPPPPPREPAYSEVFRCSEEVEFHVDPEDALVTIDGSVLGIADDWDGMGGGREWQPGTGVYFATLSLEGYESATIKIILDPRADEETCDVDTDLEELD